MRRIRKEMAPTASCDVPRFGKFDLIQGLWEGECEVPGFDLSDHIVNDGASISEDIISLLHSIADNLAGLHEAAQAYWAFFDKKEDKRWIEDCGGLDLSGIAWEDASVDVAFKDVKSVGHFFCD